LAVSERENVEQVVNHYLQAMEDKDATAAYALFSPTAKSTLPQSELQKLLEEPNYGVFSQFERASVTNIQVQTTPQRTVAVVNGTVRYEGGTTGNFRGIVRREGETWMIDGMHVTVPPSKLAKPK
jgi:hypothetical protein